MTTSRNQMKLPFQHSDFELARFAAAGYGDAFEELYRRHNRKVYALALRMLGNPAEAEDMMQEVFLQLLVKIGMFRGESAFTTWLHRMTVNQVIMHMRKRTRRSEVQSAMEDEKGEELDLCDLSPTVTDPLLRLALEEAVGELPPGYRAAFVLHTVEGYEHKEVAKILGCREGTSKSQHHKARLKLRAKLGGRAAA
jgi:RNA polymerase sigma-70 factor (ECF subfamily)